MFDINVKITKKLKVIQVFRQHSFEFSSFPIFSLSLNFSANFRSSYLITWVKVGYTSLKIKIMSFFSYPFSKNIDFLFKLYIEFADIIMVLTLPSSHCQNISAHFRRAFLLNDYLILEWPLINVLLMLLYINAIMRIYIYIWWCHKILIFFFFTVIILMH